MDSTHPHHMIALKQVKNWAPFKIDALGLVTLLGAGPVDQAVGRLSRNRFVDHLPFLALNVVAGDDINQAQPGYAVYNFSDAVVTSQLAPWFTRWLAAQDVTQCSSFLHLAYDAKGASFSRWDNALSIIVSSVVLVSMVLLAGLTEDWWAFVNAVSLIISVMCRRCILHELVHSIDTAVGTVPEHDPARIGVKCLVQFPDGKALTLFTSRGILTKVLLPRPVPLHHRRYHLARYIAWLCFGVHVISLGMSALASQLATVVVLLLSTALLVFRVFAVEDRIGSKMRVRRFDDQEGHGSYRRTYSRLKLTGTEEQSLVAWNLAPQRTNVDWWNKYRAGLADPNGTQLCKFLDDVLPKGEAMAWR
ncbi:hypothetical protein HO133_007087 [Letharia lupina]|uniref:Uncharacterized protein n=1 Tax=Letharia lupina TaxID=560253 RepID=A0A8H6KY45_9LECA|nr:uncharacterized protein HO133_007087 [Letharia lupina]KAF6228974.1 hypothetical protein HO133_007087 [Letharia lupina]